MKNKVKKLIIKHFIKYGFKSRMIKSIQTIFFSKLNF